MAQTQLDNGISHACRFISSTGKAPRCHIAKRTGTGANLTQYHESGMALRPTLANIWARGLLANRNQIMRFDDVAVRAYSGDPGALTRIQSGLRKSGLSALLCFSGWRGRSFELSMTTTMAFYTPFFEMNTGLVDMSIRTLMSVHR